MLTAYVFALVLGGGLLLASMLFGLDDAGDADVALGLEDGPGGADAKIFSLRGLVYAAFGFGGAGTLLTLFGAGTVVTALAAVVTGVGAGALVGAVFRYLNRTESGALPGDRSFAGARGRIVLPLTGGTPGAVVVARGGREIRLRALPHPSAPGDAAGWSEILVVEVEEGIARVVPVEGNTLLEP
ncbi:MAG: hypothetical protein RQ751_05430 [Longimicrobiales bacterium]|nr:hypothetical protein [Longimicrobiales bacterium]